MNGELYLLLIFRSASLASLTRETGPKVVKGDPARAAETPRVSAVSHQQHHFEPTLDISDSGLKFTHILYNLSPAGNYFYFLFIFSPSFISIMVLNYLVIAPSFF